MKITHHHGHIHVFTFREGLLSALGHDLQIAVSAFEIEVDAEAGAVAFRCDVEALEVKGAVEGGPLKEKDRRQIEKNMRQDVLNARRHPSIAYSGRLAGGDRLEGELTLCGQKQPQQVRLAKQGDRLTGELTLTPSRWGVRPYKALLGAIKLEDRVVVRFDLPDPR